MGGQGSGRKRSLVRQFSPANSNRQFSEGQKSKGILDDYPIRKHIDLKSGTVDTTPANDKDIANKAYVDNNSGQWDRTGTTLEPKTAGDDVDMGAGDISTTGTIYVDNIDEKTTDNDIVIKAPEMRTSNGEIRANVTTSKTAFRVSRAGVTFFQMVPFGGDGLHWAARDESYAAGNNTIITRDDNAEKDHDHSPSSNPTFFWHSSTNPDTDNTQWGSLSHDTNDFVIGTGKGHVKIASVSGGLLIPNSSEQAEVANSGIIYVSGGALYFKGGNGTNTQIAAA